MERLNDRYFYIGNCTVFLITVTEMEFLHQICAIIAINIVVSASNLLHSINATQNLFKHI